MVTKLNFYRNIQKYHESILDSRMSILFLHYIFYAISFFVNKTQKKLYSSKTLIYIILIPIKKKIIKCPKLPLRFIEWMFEYIWVEQVRLSTGRGYSLNVVAPNRTVLVLVARALVGGCARLSSWVAVAAYAQHTGPRRSFQLEFTDSTRSRNRATKQLQFIFNFKISHVLNMDLFINKYFYDK